MKKLIINGQEFMAEKIIKNGNSIIGINGDTIVFTFQGVMDLSSFKLESGQNYDPDPEQEREQRIADLEAALAALIGGGL
ncbi:hypothetical protein [Carboxydocella sp. ULO1]|uniref:hypothetical protein n=1 Tax=Carboxydocella sp. ULO1 TaxID=1926599 RepID=UPI0009AE7596|nr:hypothetical protein [Carboxydocella sp. ULO1]GAW28163.1 hypothetical protein ULO1_07330 [Carboxydocella sp. ULO1]